MPGQYTPRIVGPGLGVAEIIIVFAILALVILPYWKIFSKAGYSGGLSLLMLVPVLNAIMLFFLAFSKWPIEQELERLKQ